jgi:hypothetical protein
MSVEEKSTGVSDELKAEIDTAVGEVVATADSARAERAAAADPSKANLKQAKVEDAPKAEKQEPAKKEEAQPEAQPGSVTDDLVERAVKAGMSIADAKEFQKADALERVCAVLEKRGPAGGEAGDKKDEKTEDDPFASIPDLDPNEYDEKVVAGFKAMKDIIRKQHEALADMRKTGETRESVSFLDSQIATLGKAYTEAVGAAGVKLDPASPQAKARVELEGKFNVLSAGYKAAGQDVPKETVFKEAVSLVLGEVKSKADADEKDAALKKRDALKINRPSGADYKPKGDASAETASILDKKFFGKR